MSSFARSILSAIAICAIAAGCGQKGPLTLPDATEATSVPAVGGGDADEATSEETEEDDD